MKKVLFIILIYSLNINAQELEDKFSSSICECFNENQSKIDENFEINILEVCLIKSYQKTEKEFTELILKDVDTSKLENDDAYQIGFQYGQELFGTIQEKLVYECDSYYNFSIKLIALMESNIGIDANQMKVDSLTNLIDKNPKNINLLWERGAYSLGLFNYKSAQLDFIDCLKIDPNYVPALFFLGSSYNLDENPDKAIECFENILNQNKDIGSIGDMTKIYLAILKRQQIEKN